MSPLRCLLFCALFVFLFLSIEDDGLVAGADDGLVVEPGCDRRGDDRDGAAKLGEAASPEQREGDLTEHARAGADDRVEAIGIVEQVDELVLCARRFEVGTVQHGHVDHHRELQVGDQHEVKRDRDDAEDAADSAGRPGNGLFGVGEPLGQLGRRCRGIDAPELGDARLGAPDLGDDQAGELCIGERLELGGRNLGHVRHGDLLVEQRGRASGQERIAERGMFGQRRVTAGALRPNHSRVAKEMALG